MENEVKGKPLRKSLNVSGQEIHVMVNPRNVMIGDKVTEIHQPRITTVEPIATVENLIGRENMRHRNVAVYSRRDTEDEAVQAVLEGKGDVALVSALPEEHLTEESSIMVLATIDATGALPNSTLHLIGRKEVLPTSANPTNVA